MGIIFGNSHGGGGGGGLVNTLDNGLSLTGTNGQLGGPLVKNTSIGTNGHSLAIEGLVITDTEATYANAPVNPTDLLRLEDLPASPIVASNKVTGVMLSETLLDYTVPGSTSRMYDIHFAPNIVNWTSGTLVGNITYTDDFGNSNTFHYTSMFNVGAAPMPVVSIGAKNGTHIIISVTITGTMICDFMSVIEFIF